MRGNKSFTELNTGGKKNKKKYTKYPKEMHRTIGMFNLESWSICDGC